MKNLFKFFMFSAFLALAGCHSAPETSARHAVKPLPPTAQEIQQYARSQCEKDAGLQGQAKCEYGVGMRYGIQRNFYDVKKYSGRRCTVTVAWQNGRYAVQKTAGDELLCLKVWGVVSSAENLPPPPADDVHAILLEIAPE